MDDPIGHVTHVGRRVAACRQHPERGGAFLTRHRKDGCSLVGTWPRHRKDERSLVSVRHAQLTPAHQHLLPEPPEDTAGDDHRMSITGQTASFPAHPMTSRSAVWYSKSTWCQAFLFHLFFTTE